MKLFSISLFFLSVILFCCLEAQCCGSDEKKESCSSKKESCAKKESCCVSKKVIRVGAVAYGPGAVTIFENIKAYFVNNNQAFDYVLFSTYEAQVEALFNGMIDIAWNTPMAHAQCQVRSNNTCQNLVMRDVDVAYNSVILVRKDAGIATLKDLEGKTLALGTPGSAESADLACYYLQKNGVNLENVTRVNSTLDLGKHGCPGTGETDVLQALISGKAQAGTVGIGVWKRAQTDKSAEPLQLLWTSPTFSHCAFTALSNFDAKLAKRFTQIMLSMKMDDPCAKIVLEMEGAQKWVSGEETGYSDIKASLQTTSGS